MKRPSASDFDIEVTNGGVKATFKPTNSEYSYNYLVDANDIGRFGPLAPASVRHAGSTGDAGDYDSAEVRSAADRSARAAVERR